MLILQLSSAMSQQVTRTREREARIGEKIVMIGRGTGIEVEIMIGTGREIEVTSMIGTETMGGNESVIETVVGTVEIFGFWVCRDS